MTDSQQDAAEATTSGRSNDSYNIQHMPRKKAVPPMMPILPKNPSEQQPEAPAQELGWFGKTVRSFTSAFNGGRDQKPQDLAPQLITRQQIDYAHDILEERRMGPYMVKYGTYLGAVAVLLTYLEGFKAAAVKDNERWLGSVKRRVRLLGPLITMYCTSNNVLPFPYKESIEQTIGRRAICMYDIVTAKQVLSAGKQLSS